eukprot:CAMPEP_0172675406 /NCGR_PEP_ID=MMETSP1074-20121228/13246_1 /TAXON_ID=2916 /ORGANISM="Ceratium fusus, Strain PA161109" /LENGTH=90 /DNA_ID=CAMNT_0013492861 /DNA_START=91 /DNA_END=360 /DNA_ORIENTATION=-
MAKEIGEGKTAAAQARKQTMSKRKAPTRLYSRGVILGYKRSKSNCYCTTTLVKIEGVRTKEDTSFYVGKRIAYVYKGKKEIRGSKYRVMW